MSARKPWFPSLATLAAVTLVGGACGGGGDGVTPPPTQKPVASVSVTPPTASIEVLGTVQFSATLRDADGNTLTGRGIAWTSSPQTVATVSQTGLVTGVGAGEATVTATAEGRSGSAAVSVVQPVDPEVVAGGVIGAGGGAVGTPEVGVSIAAGQLASATRIEILTAEQAIEEFGNDLVTGRYRLRGFPTDRSVEVRVRLRATGPLREQSFIGLGVPVIASSVDSLGEEPGHLLREATDSAGYLVATVPVRGRAVAPAGPSGAPRPGGFQPSSTDSWPGSRE
jgi:hypothetical protein